ncbi:complex I subunit 5 family protein [Natrinema hispanicum]|uniref:Multicomponent Na+:H+ antiporter subunit D n=1 Tax=Natrinema hispanicum TaxID=392421 RepID=A0A1G6Q2W7_9EURY|nr:proton-conducting transporter membrane subunit [Natrinema hispanicum]SDC85965.1 multicomponent Na+:H+ antiporter subunit D [Natrinema hispanicum]SET31396.1 multicomponent Na+:H+ antiporter subunit D [Natrinema hispanicum]
MIATPVGTDSQLVIAPMLIVLAAATATLLLGRYPRARAAVSLAGGIAYAAAVAAIDWYIVLAPDAPGIATYQVGGWPAPFGITLVADGLSAFMLTMVAILGVASLVFSTRHLPGGEERSYYFPLFHFLALGVTGAFLTGDLFNLFVWFEVMLMASYVFVAYSGGPEHTRAAFWYVTLNLVGSAVFLLGVGGIYATTGTLNMADLAQRLAEPAAYGLEPAPVVGLFALLLSVFALKAGLVPFQFWIPSAYRAAPPQVTALLAGATKKVGIYAIIRLTFTVFAGAAVGVDLSLPGVTIAGDSPLPFIGAALFIMATASILVGGIGAVGRDSLEGVFAYSSIGQVGFIAMPVAIATTATAPGLRKLAIVAALVYALNHTLAKGLLFLSVGTVRSATGTSRFADLGGLAMRSPPLAISVFVASLALVGIPPLSGFFGKFLVFDAAARARAGPVLVVLLVGSLLTIAYTTRAWNRSFWGAQTDAVETASIDPVQVAVLAVLAATIVAVGVGFEPVYEFAEIAADAAVDTEGYVDAVAPQEASDLIDSSANGGDH